MKKLVSLSSTTTTLANREAALRLLQALGYAYLSPAQVRELRAGRTDEVLLPPVLAAALRKLNSRWQGHDDITPALTEAGVQASIEALRRYPPAQDYLAASRYLYELLTLGRYHAVAGPGGEHHVHAVRYLDWETPANNSWHVTEEFTVARTGQVGSYTPDIVLHVNGIPLVVLDCQATDPFRSDPAGVTRQLRFQTADGIRSLYVYAQLLLAVSGAGPARYATTATPAEGWARWRERRADTPAQDGRLAQLQHLRAEATFQEAYYAALRPHPAHAGRYAPARDLLALEATPTPQDELLFQLCEPARLLEIVRDYLVFEPGRKVVARYHQYYAVRRTLAALLAGQPGGVLWHTQGSGKTLTLVLLARQLTRHPAFPGAQVVVVSDRAELDQQLTAALRQAGLAVAQASTGAALVHLLSETHAPAIITTLIQKFAAVVKALRPVERDNLFVLVDEGHRTQYGQLGAQMRRVFPRARFIAFTGTPLQRAERSTAELFGGYLHHYTAGEAVRDGTLLPLLYQSRQVGQRASAVPDNEVEVSGRGELAGAQESWQARAWDIATHFRHTWSGTGFKGQVLVPSRLAAVRLKHLLDATGLVESEVLLAPTGEHEGHWEGRETPTDEVQAYWAAVTARFGRPAQYEQQVRSQWLDPASGLELLITVDKLLTGFDNPYNAVLYLCRRLSSHQLFQALARVNRPAPGKAHGFVLDYEGNLAALRVALASFATEDFADYEIAALRGAAEPGVSLLDAAEQLAPLDAARTSLHALFRGRVAQSRDSAAYARVLADDELRREFFAQLQRFAQLVQFGRSARLSAPDEPAAQWTQSEQDLVAFENVRRMLVQYYSLRTDADFYEPLVQRLLADWEAAGWLRPLVAGASIFEQEQFAAEIAALAPEGSSAQGLTVLTRTQRALVDLAVKYPARAEQLRVHLARTLGEYETGELSGDALLARARQHEGAVLRAAGWPVASSSSLRDEPAAAAALRQWLQAYVRETVTTSRKPAAVDVAAWASQTETLLRPLVLDPVTTRPRVDARQSRVRHSVRQLLEDQLWQLRELLPALIPSKLDDLVDQLEIVAQQQYDY
jgi:type I restriction enzyme R subunit